MLEGDTKVIYPCSSPYITEGHQSFDQKIMLLLDARVHRVSLAISQSKRGNSIRFVSKKRNPVVDADV